jgi:hypothetical protein
MGDAEQARWHWQQALSLFTELGAPGADQVRAHLDNVGPAQRLGADPAQPAGHK